MAYLALYRQHRPRTLAEVVDQSHIVRTLGNAITSGKLVHAYLFTGPRGTGKTSVARVLARSLNCEHGPTLTPCGSCASCLAIDSGAALDVREIDAASNRGIDDIRDLRQSIQYVAESRYKIYIIDEVHMLSQEAFNALLKTLEEPPEHVIFILATTEVHKIPLTILSRCQRFDFHRISKAAMITLLRRVVQQSESSISEEALELLAERAQGGLRDALSMLDQCLIYAAGEIGEDDLLTILGSVDQDTLIKLMNMVVDSDAPAMLQLLDQIEDSGRDLVQLLYDLMRLLRNSVAKPNNYKDALKLQSEPAIRALDHLSRSEAEMKYAAQPRLSLELALLRISEEIAYGGRIQALEARLTALELGQTAPPPSVTQSTVQRSASREVSERGAEAIIARPGTQSPITHKAETDQTTGQALDKAKPKDATVQAFTASKEAPPAAMETVQDISETIKANWEQILDRIKKERIALHAILQNGRILGTNEGQLEIVFAQDFHRKILERPENRTLLEQTIQNVSGVSCRLRIVLTKDIVGRSAAKPVPAAQLTPSQALATQQTEAEDLLLDAAIALVGASKVKVIG